MSSPGRKALQQTPEREHANLRALAAVRTVLTREHLAAVEAVFGGDLAANELLALRHGPWTLARLSAEACDAGGVHARGVVREVAVERGLVLQPVLDRAADLARDWRRVREHFGREEARQLQDVRDVVAQPRVERTLDGGIRFELDFVDDLACAREYLAHGRKGTKRVRRSA